MTQPAKNPFVVILVAMFTLLAFLLGCGGGGGSSSSSNTDTTVIVTEDLNLTFINKGVEEGRFEIEVRLNGSLVAGDSYSKIIAKDGIFQTTIANADSTATISFDIKERIETPTEEFLDVSFEVNLANRPNVEVEIIEVNVNPVVPVVVVTSTP